MATESNALDLDPVPTVPPLVPKKEEFRMR
jgi:hypothetical protein